MTEPETTSPPGVQDFRERYDELLREAVRVLTDAARLTWSTTDPDGRSVARPADWAEFLTLALAGAAANVGGIEAVLAGRPGSWEADGVRQLLASTVGHDQHTLWEHRTEPVVVDVYVDELLVDLGAWKTYDDAQQELTRRYDAIGIPSTTGVPGDPVHEQALAQLEPATEEQERQAEVIGQLEDRLERMREQDWAAYGQALTANIEAAAARVEGLRVPVVVNVDLDTFRPDQDRDASNRLTLARRLLDEAVEATPLPGDGRSPLQRLPQ